MNAGDLSWRIAIERVTIGYDEFNAPIEKWATLACVWSEKKDIKDRERLLADGTSADITTRFRIRYSALLADINPKDRVIYAGRIYDIFGVKEVGNREGFEITAAAKAD